MKAITIKQPWAWAIALGAKTVENRSRQHPWTSALGERIAIHAGKGWDRDAFDTPALFRVAEHVCSRLYGDDRGYPAAALINVMAPQFHHRGAVLATAQLIDVHLDSTASCDCAGNPWAQRGTWHLVLDEIQPLPQPTPARGALGLWTLP
jgi:hypothetical protein